MDLRLSLTLALVLGCLACSSPQKVEDTPEPGETAQTEDSETPPADEPPAEVRELDIDFSSARDEPDTATVEVCLDCFKRSATYQYCHFDKAALEATLGAENMGNRLNVEIEMVEGTAETYVPKDPNMPQPDGGFTHEHFSCTVLQILKP